MPLSLKDEVLDAFKNAKSENRRIAALLAILTRECRLRGVSSPALVGGGALQLYTGGQYRSNDLDIVGDRETLDSILLEIGFKKTNERSIYWSEELNILIDWQGGCISGEGAAQRAFRIRSPNGPLYLISLTDLILDRLNAAKWWKDATSAEWTETMLHLAQDGTFEIDWELLRNHAEKADVLDMLDSILQQMKSSADEEDDDGNAPR